VQFAYGAVTEAVQLFMLQRYAGVQVNFQDRPYQTTAMFEMYGVNDVVQGTHMSVVVGMLTLRMSICEVAVGRTCLLFLITVCKAA